MTIATNLQDFDSYFTNVRLRFSSLQAKYDQRRSQHKQTILPMIRSEPNFNNLNVDRIKVNRPDAELTSRHHQYGQFQTTRPYYNGFIPNYASQSYKDV